MNESQLMIMETQRDLWIKRSEIQNVMKYSHWQYMIIIVFAKRIAEGSLCLQRGLLRGTGIGSL